MSFEFVRSDVLLNVHGRLIQTYGGLPGVRDNNGLESAIARPRNLHVYAGERHVPVLSAALGWAILRGHPFTDGNKRTALAAIVLSAHLNSHRLTCTAAEETAMVIQGAASQVTEEEWTAWAMRVIVPVAVDFSSGYPDPHVSSQVAETKAR